MTLKTLVAAVSFVSFTSLSMAADKGFWSVYDTYFKDAKYIDLTHTITPDIPVWPGFGGPQFSPAKAAEDLGQFGEKGEAFTYEKQGFEATAYTLPTDQLGTQLDPPAHWAPEYPAIDELPATYSLRPLVVIPMQEKVAEDFGYALQVSDILDFEDRHGRIPQGSVVFVRSDWSKSWPDKAFAARTPFPGVGLEALKFLHEDRKILFHGHEPLDTDATPDLEGEYWLMHNGYAQAEGVANLDKVPPVGCLVSFGFPKIKGGVGGYARYIAICPADWEFGDVVSDADAPLPKHDAPLRWDESAGMRVR